MTLNFVRALIDGGFADLHHPEYWELGFMRHAPLRDSYQKIVDSIAESMDFFESMSGQRVHAATRVDFYTSHEGLHLLSEQAQTRYIERQKRWYNLSTHMPWIGMRTANIDGAHVEYFRGISNPDRRESRRGDESGMAAGIDSGVESAKSTGPPDIHPSLRHQGCRTAPARHDSSRARHRVRRCCGCAIRCTAIPRPRPAGVKTRRFDNILGEVEAAFRIHEQEGSMLGGVHIELTGEDVTECIGGARGLTEADLARAYKSLVDPRLNAEQAMELAMLIARRAGAGSPVNEERQAGHLSLRSCEASGRRRSLHITLIQ